MASCFVTQHSPHAKIKIRWHSCESFFFLCLSINLFCSCMMEPLFAHAFYCQCHWAACSHYIQNFSSFSLLTFLSCNACFIANGISCSKFKNIFFNIMSSFSLVPNTHIIRALPNITKHIRFFSQASHF